jgi:hypothetical protein
MHTHHARTHTHTHTSRVTTQIQILPAKSDDRCSSKRPCVSLTSPILHTPARFPASLPLSARPSSQFTVSKTIIVFTGLKFRFRVALMGPRCSSLPSPRSPLVRLPVAETDFESSSCLHDLEIDSRVSLPHYQNAIHLKQHVAHAWRRSAFVAEQVKVSTAERAISAANLEQFRESPTS